MGDSKGSKRWLEIILQEQDELHDGNSEVILDQEPPSEFASRVYNGHPELREKRSERPNLNPNSPWFGHILYLNAPGDWLPQNRFAPFLTFPHRTLPLPVPTGARRIIPVEDAAVGAPPRVSQLSILLASTISVYRAVSTRKAPSTSVEHGASSFSK